MLLPEAPSPQPKLVDLSSSIDLQQPSSISPGVAPAATLAQDSTPAKPQDTAADRRARAEKQLKDEEHQHIFGVVPNYNTVIGGYADPLTAGEKFQLFFKSSVNPFVFVSTALIAGYEQATEAYYDYGGGIGGYSKRYGASFADTFDGNFWGNAVLPALLKQDPRYFRLGEGRFKNRLWYSLISTVRSKGDNGKWQPAYANIGGNFIGGAISNVYYPASDRGLSLTFQRGATITAEGAIGSLLVEFYPDIEKKLVHRKHLPSPQP